MIDSGASLHKDRFRRIVALHTAHTITKKPYGEAFAVNPIR